MPQWYVKELSKLTHISVQTLHYYDRIDLLKPSVRLANGYRLYAEQDLLKLQQIISLKFFGFDLSQIKKLFNTNGNIIEPLSLQSALLEKKANAMLAASNTLKAIIADCDQAKPIAWETIIELMEVYRLTEQLEKTWVGKFLNQEELKQYARFEQDLKARFTSDEIAQLEKDRASLICQIEKNLDHDPSGDFGAKIAKRGMDWANHFYGKKYASLRSNIWKKGYKTDHINQVDQSDFVSAASVAWFDKAIESYYFNRLIPILNQVDQLPQALILTQWDEILTEMYGDSASLKNELVTVLLLDDRLNQQAKNWLKQLMNK